MPISISNEARVLAYVSFLKRRMEQSKKPYGPKIISHRHILFHTWGPISEQILIHFSRVIWSVFHLLLVLHRLLIEQCHTWKDNFAALRGCTQKTPHRNTQTHTKTRVWAVLCELLDTRNQKSSLRSLDALHFRIGVCFLTSTEWIPKDSMMQLSMDKLPTPCCCCWATDLCRADFALGAPKFPGIWVAPEMQWTPQNSQVWKITSPEQKKYVHHGESVPELESRTLLNKEIPVHLISHLFVKIQWITCWSHLSPIL